MWMWIWGVVVVGGTREEDSKLNIARGICKLKYKMCSI